MFQIVAPRLTPPLPVGVFFVHVCTSSANLQNRGNKNNNDVLTAAFPRELCELDACKALVLHTNRLSGKRGGGGGAIVIVLRCAVDPLPPKYIFYK